MSKAMEVNVPACELQVGDKVVFGAEYNRVTDLESDDREVTATFEDGAIWGYDYNEPVRIRKR